MGSRERSELRERLRNSESTEDKWLILGNEVQKLIRKEAKIKEGNMLDVTSFVNLRVNPMFRFFGEILSEAYTKKYGPDYITNVLTVKSSGNIFAGNTGFELYKYTIIGQKGIPKILEGEELYSSEAESYTGGEKYNIIIPKSFIEEGDIIFIADDFIATGSSTFALLEMIINQAHAKLAGIAALITKDYKGQEGYKILGEFVKEYNLNHKNKASLNTLVRITDMSTTIENIKYGKSPLRLN